MKNNDMYVFFELNNWIQGVHYPDEHPFDKWLEDDCNIYFNDEEWVKNNKLCVVVNIIDMSLNFCVTATKEWVLENCPRLLTVHRKFLRFQEEGEDAIYGDFNDKFLEYDEKNIGIHWSENI